ncbi:endolytic transglycosylase MltG [Devriesea agamarum]|uniref:endolytic transglycosylase MltG n=1 Tax=Devriesea agamarum TaxID=472569 RepID=UPI00071D26F4|nr:endolytic transglycosylase MltG [Devriesea agamarum]
MNDIASNGGDPTRQQPGRSVRRHGRRRADGPARTGPVHSAELSLGHLDPPHQQENQQVPLRPSSRRNARIQPHDDDGTPAHQRSAATNESVDAAYAARVDQVALTPTPAEPADPTPATPDSAPTRTEAGRRDHDDDATLALTPVPQSALSPDSSPGVFPRTTSRLASPTNAANASPVSPASPDPAIRSTASERASAAVASPSSPEPDTLTVFPPVDPQADHRHSLDAETAPREVSAHTISEEPATPDRIDIADDEHSDHHDEHEILQLGSGTEEKHRESGCLRSFLPALLVIIVLLGGGVGLYYGYQALKGSISISDEPTDYPGPGTGEVRFEIKRGESGSDIAKNLVKQEVIASSAPFVTLFTATPEAAKIQPGTYKLKQHMSSREALDALLDPANVAHRVTIPEGLRMTEMFPRLSKATGIPEAEFEAAAKDYKSIGVPDNPANSAEGYLFPSTYDLPDKATAKDILTMMVNRTKDTLTEKKVPQSEWHRVLTLASIAEKEARSPEDYGKVVRVIDNRLAGVGEASGRPMNLQMDSTVAYITGKKVVSTTPAERASKSPYNTYNRPGLPIGPISNPGEQTIDAALNPPAGPWLYWVTVNTDTGETKFASTKAEHDQYVEQWKQWFNSKQRR